MDIEKMIAGYKDELQQQTTLYNQAAVNIERLRGAIAALNQVLKAQNENAATACPPSK